MLNLKNDHDCMTEKNPMNIVTLAENASFACRRPVGEGYYDQKENKTLLCWNGRGMDVYLRKFDHGKHAFTEEELVCKNDMFGLWDYHNYVNMVDDGEGQPILFHAIHSNCLFQITKEEDGTWKKQMISEDKVCYPAPVSFGGVIYVFYSKNDELSYPYRTYRYIKSEDHGKSWSDPKTILDSEKKMPRRFDEIYMCGSELTTDGKKHFVQLTWTMWGGPGGHASQGRGAFYVQFCLEDETLYSADGEWIGSRAGYQEIMEKCFIEASEPDKELTHTNAGPVSVRCRDGAPIVVYGIRGKGSLQDGVIRMARMTEGKWQIQDLVQGCFNVEDMCIREKAIEFVAAQGDKVAVYQADPGSGACVLKSATAVPRRKEADCFYYINYIDKHRQDLQLMVGMGHDGCVPSYYEGIWDIILLGEGR